MRSLRQVSTVYANDLDGHGFGPLALGELGSGGFELLVQDMVRMSEIARAEDPDLAAAPPRHDMGSFAAQRYVIDHSHEIDGLMLSGSGAARKLGPAALPETAGSNCSCRIRAGAHALRLAVPRSGDRRCVFMPIPSVSKTFTPTPLFPPRHSTPRLYDPVALRQDPRDLPIYLFSGSEAPRSGSTCGDSAD